MTHTSHQQFHERTAHYNNTDHANIHHLISSFSFTGSQLITGSGDFYKTDSSTCVIKIVLARPDSYKDCIRMHLQAPQHHPNRQAAGSINAAVRENTMPRIKTGIPINAQTINRYG